MSSTLLDRGAVEVLVRHLFSNRSPGDGDNDQINIRTKGERKNNLFRQHNSPNGAISATAHLTSMKGLRLNHRQDPANEQREEAHNNHYRTTGEKWGGKLKEKGPLLWRTATKAVGWREGEGKFSVLSISSVGKMASRGWEIATWGFHHVKLEK